MLKLFYSYAREDRAWCDRLSRHLLGLPKDLVSEGWYDRQIRPGDEWNGEIGKHLEEADIVLLLVSPNYFASEYCNLEAEFAMERHAQGRAIVIPVMLTYYNVSGAVFAKLQSVPPPDKPLSSWPESKFDEPLADISRVIQERAREITGAGPKYRLPHPNREELARLLYHLCDRTVQKQEIIEALSPDQRKDGRPFLIFTRGAREDAIDRFVDRLEHILLPWVFREKPTRLPPLAWPVYRARKSPVSLFGPPLADALSANFGATVAEMDESIRACTDVVLLTSRFYAHQWSGDGKTLLESFIQFWSDWPQLKTGKHLIVTIPITYGETASTNREIDGFLEALTPHLTATGVDSRGVGGAVLSPFPPVSEDEVKNWVDERQVRVLFKSAPEAIDRLSYIFEKPDLRIPMQPLAEVHLPRWLDRL